MPALSWARHGCHTCHTTPLESSRAARLRLAVHTVRLPLPEHLASLGAAYVRALKPKERSAWPGHH